MIKRAKGFELMIFLYIINWNTFDSKVFFTFKIMDFENNTYLIDFGLYKSLKIPTHILFYSKNKTVI
jgi:hypothetical protein